MSCFLSPCLQFSFPKSFLGPAWPHISWSLVSTYNPRSSILHSPQSTCFLQCHFCVFFVESDAQVTPKWTQHTIFWKLFFNNNAKTEKCVWTAPAWTECIWAHPVERSGGFKIRRKVNCEQNVPGKLKGARKTQEKRLPLRSRWAPRPRRFFLISH